MNIYFPRGKEFSMELVDSISERNAQELPEVLQFMVREGCFTLGEAFLLFDVFESKNKNKNKNNNHNS